MEDSGIDSEDKFSSFNGEYIANEQIDRNISFYDDDLPHDLQVSFRDAASGYKTSDSNREDSPVAGQVNTCRALQRKLELKVERAKRNYYNQYKDEPQPAKSHTSTLMPINRLKIPGVAENVPLVDYKSDSDEPEEVSFFPVKLKNVKKQDLSDTFSIQEMTIESDDNHSDDSGSQNLELLPPGASGSAGGRLLNKLLGCFSCAGKQFK